MTTDTSNVSILIVDDEKSIRLTLGAFLEGAGYSVRRASDHAEAVRIAEEGALDAAFVDVLLGRDSGVAVAEALRERYPRLQIVFMTGDPGVVSARAAIRLRAFDYLTKPVGKETVIEVAKRAVAEKHRLDEYERLREAETRHRERLEDEVAARTRSLAESEAKYRLLVENMNDVIYEVEADRNVNYVSPAIESMLGYAPEELTGRSFEPLIHPEDLPRVQQGIADTMAGNPYPVELRIRTRDGAYRWVRGLSRRILSPDGTPRGMQGVLMDIHARREAELELGHLEARHRSVFEQAGVGIGFWTPDARVISMNRLACAVLGTDEDALVGKSMAELFGPDRGREYTARIDETVERGVRCQFEDVVDLAEGVKVYISTYSPIRDTNGDTVGVLIVSHDVTRDRRAEQEIRQLNATLDAAQKMARIGYWRYDVATQMPTWSDQMFEVCGRRKEDGVPSYEDHKRMWHPDDWGMFDSAVQGCIRGTPYNIVTRIRFPDGSYHRIHTQGFPIRDESGEIRELFGTSQDVTELARQFTQEHEQKRTNK